MRETLVVNVEAMLVFFLISRSSGPFGEDGDVRRIVRVKWWQFRMGFWVVYDVVMCKALIGGPSMGRPRAGCATRIFRSRMVAETKITRWVERRGLKAEEEEKRRFLG